MEFEQEFVQETGGTGKIILSVVQINQCAKKVVVGVFVSDTTMDIF